jgi:hypothetical protein
MIGLNLMITLIFIFSRYFYFKIMNNVNSKGHTEKGITAPQGYGEWPPLQVRWYSPTNQQVLLLPKFFLVNEETVTELTESCDGKAIYVLTSTKVDQSKLYRLTPQGKVEWSYLLNHPGVHQMKVTKDGTVFIHARSDRPPREFWSFHPPKERAGYPAAIFVFSPKGRLKWQIKGSSFRDPENPFAMAVSPDGDLYVGTEGGEVRAFSPEGSLRWKDTLSKCPNIALSPDGKLLYGSGVDKWGNFYLCQWDTKIGKIRWKIKKSTIGCIFRIGEIKSVSQDKIALIETEDLYVGKIWGEIEEKMIKRGINPSQIDPNLIYQQIQKKIQQLKRFLVVMDKDGRVLFQKEAKTIDYMILGEKNCYVVTHTTPDFQGGLIRDERIYALTYQGKLKWSHNFNGVTLRIQAELFSYEDGEEVYVLVEEPVKGVNEPEEVEGGPLTVHKLYRIKGEGGEKEVILTIENSDPFYTGLSLSHNRLYLTVSDGMRQGILVLQVQDKAK